MQNCDIAEDKDILEEKLERKQRGTKTYSQKNSYKNRSDINTKFIKQILLKLLFYLQYIHKTLPTNTYDQLVKNTDIINELKETENT